MVFQGLAVLLTLDTLSRKVNPLPQLERLLAGRMQATFLIGSNMF